MTGRLADGWVPSIRGDRLGELGEMNDRVDEGAAEAGRDPGSIRRVYNVNGTITDGASEGFLRGPADQWVDELSTLAADFRGQTFIFWGDGDDQLRRFAEEVVPATRAALQH
jgi:alkanesulfonate monooxygenase SsuD/methylene tetrahydromethanopterin reductase-like flavin-dependent oxidoreductase (luciferase family)